MSKELEALKEARNFRHEKDEHLVVIDIDYFNRCLDGIEASLERLVELEDIFSEIESGEAVVISAEKRAALEIIKEKMVNTCEIINSKDVREYNWSIHTPKKYPLTQEEYYLLKEVLL